MYCFGKIQNHFVVVFSTILFNLCNVFAESNVNYTEKTYGLWADCPGSEKPAIITPRSLRFLSVRVEGPKGRRSYNYYQMRDLARDKDIDFSRKTVIFVAGYMSNPDLLYARVVARHYVDLNRYNVLLLDVLRFMLNPYPVATRFMKTAGYHTAEMLVELQKYGLNPKQVELIGVSLGGQTVSFIAKSYKQITGVKLSRVTGLDPAGPCFRNRGPEGRIDKEDADLVDIVSTNINSFGMAAPVGHINFYVNGGEYQPGDGFWLLCNVYCSHARSLTLWMSAISNPHAFIALKCDSVQQARLHQCYDRKPQETNVMGLEIDRNKTGIFYLASDHNYPYFMGKRGLIKENQFYASHLSDFNESDLLKV